MRRSGQTDQLFSALLEVQRRLKLVSRNQRNATARRPYRYADLAQVVASTRALLVKHGIVVVQSPSRSSLGFLTLTTLLQHAPSAQWVEDDFTVSFGGDIQAAGSLITYMRRYTLGAMVGLAIEPDDDGQSTVHADTEIGDPIARVRVLEVLKESKSRSGKVTYRFKGNDGKVYRTKDKTRWVAVMSVTVAGSSPYAELDVAYRLPSGGQYGDQVRDITAVSVVPLEERSPEPSL